MANKILLKKSSIPAKIPQPDDLVYGELALNYADGKLYYKTSDNVIGSIGGSALSVDVLDTTNSPVTHLPNITSIGFDSTSRFNVVDLGGGVVKIGLDDSPLVFTTAGDYRTLTGYTEAGVEVPVRTAEFISNKLRLTLASFSPVLTATVSPASTLNWDVPCTGFTVSVTNPDDFTAKWISSVTSITATTGTISALSAFTANAPTAVPGPTIDWNQTFNTDVDSYVRPSSTSGISGGSAAGNIKFNYTDASGAHEYASSATISVAWNTPAVSVAMTNLTGNHFLQSYASTTYSVSVTGMSAPANYATVVTPVGGSVSNASGSGSITFSAPIHKDNIATERSISVTTTFTRPATVAGVSYTAQATATDPAVTASFTYPSLRLFTPSIASIPVRSDVVTGTAFKPEVTVLGDQVKVLTGFINNTSTVPQAMWLAVKATAAQPTVFKTGASSSLLSDTTVTASTVSLAPDSPLAGYNGVTYNLYGITLQPGSTYVSIL